MRAHLCATVLPCLLLPACADRPDAAYPTAQGLGLDRVVLYRNGVGYFERSGELDGDILRLKVRKDQINDLLKSLTIVDRKTGKALSVSMPLDPQTWATAALASLDPGSGSLAAVLDALRGTRVTLATTLGDIDGRVVMVEDIDEEPDPTAASPRPGLPGAPVFGHDHKVTLLQGKKLEVVRLSKVQSVIIKDGDLAMQFHRRLDATAGEGMFQQVDVDVRLEGAGQHDLAVSYVVEAPMWKPTYRVVLPEKGKKDALLQGWAVVDNTSGEDWGKVRMSLTAGEPLAFRYDLYTPRHVFREDVSERVHNRRAEVATGETSFVGEDKQAEQTVAPAADAAMPAPPAPMGPGEGGGAYAANATGRTAMAKTAMPAMPARHYARARGPMKKPAGGAFVDGQDKWGKDEEAPAFNLDALRQSTLARAHAVAASGLTRFDLGSRVTVPDGTSTMLAIINDVVQGEETFLFKPGGAGQGFENNPYRVVRFRNSTPFVLEPGPISIFSAGSFVGEGISEVVGAGSSATIPFAVEPGIMVTRETDYPPQEVKLVKIVRGVLHVERFSRFKTVWKATAQTLKDGFTVLVRHPRYSPGYHLKDRPDGLEELPDAYLVPVKVPPGSLTGMIELIEQEPTRTTIAVLDPSVPHLFEQMLAQGDLTPEERRKLEPVVDVRREIGKIDSAIDSDHVKQRELDQRAGQTRANLAAIAADKSPEAAKLRKDLQARLDAWTKEGDRLGREIVALDNKKQQLKIKLDDVLQDLSIGK